MTARQITNRLVRLEKIIENDEMNNYHTTEYIKKIYKEKDKLEKDLYFACAR